jgi:hypothetical protein
VGSVNVNNGCDALLSIDMGARTDFELQGSLNPIAQARTVGPLVSADFSNTVQLASIELLDSNRNPLGPVTLTGSSGFIYGQAPQTLGLLAPVLLLAVAALIRHSKFRQLVTYRNLTKNR